MAKKPKALNVALRPDGRPVRPCDPVINRWTGLPHTKAREIARRKRQMEK